MHLLEAEHWRQWWQTRLLHSRRQGFAIGHSVLKVVHKSWAVVRPYISTHTQISIRWDHSSLLLRFRTTTVELSLSFSPHKLLLCSTLYQIRVSLTTTSLSFLLDYLFQFFYLYEKQPRRNIPIISNYFFSFQISEWLNIRNQFVLFIYWSYMDLVLKDFACL